MREQVKIICPHCNQPIEADEKKTFCTFCGIPHHTKCWEENQGCTTALCPGKEANNKAIPQGPICTVCGSEIKLGQKFCAKCGTSIEYKNICMGCGAELKEGQRFCQKCGKPVEESAPAVEEKKEADPNACKNCGTILKPEQKFCQKCGKTVGESAHGAEEKKEANPNACKNCGTILKPEQKFCQKCGTPRG